MDTGRAFADRRAAGQALAQALAGRQFADFRQLSDEDVVQILDAADAGMGLAEVAPSEPARE